MGLLSPLDEWRTQIITGPRFPVMHDSGTMMKLVHSNCARPKPELSLNYAKLMVRAEIP